MCFGWRSAREPEFVVYARPTFSCHPAPRVRRTPLLCTRIFRCVRATLRGGAVAAGGGRAHPNRRSVVPGYECCACACVPVRGALRVCLPARPFSARSDFISPVVLVRRARVPRDRLVRFSVTCLLNRRRCCFNNNNRIRRLSFIRKRQSGKSIDSLIFVVY